MYADTHSPALHAGGSAVGWERMLHRIVLNSAQALTAIYTCRKLILVRQPSLVGLQRGRRRCGSHDPPGVGENPEETFAKK